MSTIISGIIFTVLFVAILFVVAIFISSASESPWETVGVIILIIGLYFGMSRVLTEEEKNSLRARVQMVLHGEK